MIFWSFSLYAQTDFSGRWQFDKANSSPKADYSRFDGTVVRQIAQTPVSFSYFDTYTQKNGENWKSSEDSFTLDGKDQIVENAGIKTAKWSADKKVLTLSYSEKYTENGVNRELMVSESYALSADGSSLIIDTYTNNQVVGEVKTKSIFTKK